MKLLKTISVIIISIAFTTNIHSQTWCPPGATWYYTDGAMWWDGYSKFTYTNDTVINTIICKKITHYLEGLSNTYSHSYGYSEPYFTYTQNGVAYLYNNKYGNNKFDTLFDMNAQINDKWRSPLVDTACADSVYFMKVLNTGTKTINGFNLKWLYVKAGPLPYNNYYYEFDTITERLGYRFDIDYSICHNIIAEIPTGGLRCYSDNIFGFYSTGISNSCDYYYTGIAELQRGQRGLKIYPNPANDILNIIIHLEQGQTALLGIYDLAGKLVLSNTLNGSIDILETSIGTLSEGIYIYKVNVNNTLVDAGKLSIIH